MILPSVGECKKNKKQLIRKWLKNISSNNKELEKLKYFFQKCFVFHHFIISEEIVYYHDFTSKAAELLSDGLLKSSYDIRASKLFHPVGATIERLDPLLGLDQYIFFTFGAPRLPTGKNALVFGLPLQSLLEKYKYPQIWASWGDIFTYAIDTLGNQVFYDHKINELQVSRIAQQYQEVIFLPEDIAELAAVFTISHYIDVSEAINHRWRKRYSGYFGPEIKIFRNFLLKHITHCFIDEPSSKAGKIAKFLYQKGILPVEPIIDRFFHQDIFKRFYIEYMGISI